MDPLEKVTGDEAADGDGAEERGTIECGVGSAECGMGERKSGKSVKSGKGRKSGKSGKGGKGRKRRGFQRIVVEMDLRFEI